MDLRDLELAPALQELQLDHEGGAYDGRPDLGGQARRRRGGAAGRQQIVDQEDALPPRSLGWLLGREDV